MAVPHTQFCFPQFHFLGIVCKELYILLIGHTSSWFLLLGEPKLASLAMERPSNERTHGLVTERDAWVAKCVMDTSATLLWEW